MNELLDRDLEVELHDVFHVMQVTRGTPLEAEVAADLVSMDPGQTSQIHRHNLAETVLYFLEGAATVRVGDDELAVTAGDRVLIGKAVFHGVRTGAEGCRFLSVQTPPILNKTTGFRDLEPLDQA
jgi:quercetin dioxygenase-like cupin family protein